MLLSSLFSGIVLFLILWGHLATPLLWGLSFSVFIGFYIYNKKRNHQHGGFLSIDYYAQMSKLRELNPGLKVLLSLGTLFICLASNTLLVSGIVIVVMSVLTIGKGKTPVSYYISLMLLPMSFILLSGIAMIVEFSKIPLGHLDVSFFGGYLSVTPQGQEQALLVIVRAVAAITCLYMLSLSTPMNETIGTLRRGKVPALFIELMYLIYHYIFVLLSQLNNMSSAASARLGYYDKKTSFKTGISIGRNLFLVSFTKVSHQFDAMESRCYEGDLQFLEKQYRWNLKQTVLVLSFLVFLLMLTLFLKRGY